MENSLRPFVEIQLGTGPQGEPLTRRLQFDMNSIAELEGVTDLPVIADPGAASLFVRIAASGPGIRYTRALLWSALLHSEPRITLPEAGNLISIGNMQQVSLAINQALRLFFRQQGLPLAEAEEKPTLLT